jgi:hypothetical protein
VLEPVRDVAVGFDVPVPANLANDEAVRRVKLVVLLITLNITCNPLYAELIVSGTTITPLEIVENTILGIASKLVNV